MIAKPQPDAPFFVVGCPRSGTTLMRAILDGHPRLVIPSESHFIVGLGTGMYRRRRRPETVDELLGHPELRKWSLDADAVRRRFAAARQGGYREVVSAVYEQYAAQNGKPRWGDKTPEYVRHLPELLHVFPEAQVIHMIRDGREVAGSLADRPFGPPTAIGGAFKWRRWIEPGLRDGRRLPAGQYLEVRLERLSADPEEEVRRVCAFLGEDYDPTLLDYPSRLTVLAAFAGPRHAHRHLTRPPTPDLRNWRAKLGPTEARAVEAVCRDLLEELGYQLSFRRSRAAFAYAQARRVIDAPAAAWKAWRTRRIRRPRLSPDAPRTRRDIDVLRLR